MAILISSVEKYAATVSYKATSVTIPCLQPFPLHVDLNDPVFVAWSEWNSRIGVPRDVFAAIETAHIRCCGDKKAQPLASPTVKPCSTSTTTAKLAPAFTVQVSSTNGGNKMLVRVYTMEMMWIHFDTYFVDEVQGLFGALNYIIDTIHDSVEGHPHLCCIVCNLISNGDDCNIMMLLNHRGLIGSLYYSSPPGEAIFVPATASVVINMPERRFIGNFYA
ncbi:uncharacterized protein EV420DRAFT_1653020 [Desarmillaria tabescens]|uniref:Uncharacterized protein n=1 Tax=Armillaria tabescens TaxID=1929756 RepID=A0AA39J5A1_ARMTA|nr:uncharacterized protein EV420DRAFT_1653020 [Desarmillaria tabescens]KAK0435705.1 hypothetical protein EV420DRAFT_1653020 [Desarmillaria tabescens]